MSVNLPALIRDHRLMTAAVTDPDLTRDAKVFVVCTLARNVQLRTATREQRFRARTRWFQDVNAMARGGATGYWVRMVICSDLPRYEVAKPAPLDCVSPARDGEGLCGKPAYIHFFDRDPVTGEGRWLAHCTGHWSHEKNMLRINRRKAWFAAGRPSPPPTTGGFLARYISVPDWNQIYSWASPSWRPVDPNFGQPADPTRTPRARPRAALRLIPGGKS